MKNCPPWLAFSGLSSGSYREGSMLHAGLDLSRKRLDFCLLDESGERIEVGATPPDADGLRSLARRLRAARPAGAGGDRVDERRPLRP